MKLEREFRESKKVKFNEKIDVNSLDNDLRKINFVKSSNNRRVTTLIKDLIPFINKYNYSINIRNNITLQSLRKYGDLGIELTVSVRGSSYYVKDLNVTHIDNIFINYDILYIPLLAENPFVLYDIKTILKLLDYPLNSPLFELIPIKTKKGLYLKLELV